MKLPLCPTRLTLSRNNRGYVCVALSRSGNLNWFLTGTQLGRCKILHINKLDIAEVDFALAQHVA